MAQLKMSTMIWTAAEAVVKLSEDTKFGFTITDMYMRERHKKERMIAMAEAAKYLRVALELMIGEKVEIIKD